MTVGKHLVTSQSVIVNKTSTRITDLVKFKIIRFNENLNIYFYLAKHVQFYITLLRPKKFKKLKNYFVLYGKIIDVTSQFTFNDINPTLQTLPLFKFFLIF